MECRNTVGRGMVNGRRRRRQCCLIGAAFYSAGSGGSNSAVAFGYVGGLSQQLSSSRWLRVAGGGRGVSRRSRVPSSPAQGKALFATARRRNAFVVEGGGANPVTSSSTADWRDLTKEVRFCARGGPRRWLCRLSFRLLLCCCISMKFGGQAGCFRAFLRGMASLRIVPASFAPLQIE